MGLAGECGSDPEDMGHMGSMIAPFLFACSGTLASGIHKDASLHRSIGERDWEKDNRSNIHLFNYLFISYKLLVHLLFVI